MIIQNLKIYNFRCIKEVEYDLIKQVNVFHGDNGVGKTSVLEAIHFLSTGKSFRKCTYKNLIKHNENKLTTYIKGEDNTISVEKNKNGKWKAKYNNNLIHKQSHVTSILPIVSIDPDVYRLVEAGPISRRNFLDWLVFHVEHKHLLLWKQTYKCIKQLNTLYKFKASSEELNLWEKNLVLFATKLTLIREEYYKKIEPIVYKQAKLMLPEVKNITIEFKKGWSEHLSFDEQLTKDRKKNLLYGTLQNGPQKMDIVIKANGINASQTLSRGQKKILSISFYMAYVKLLVENNVLPIICLDDFDAELDKIKFNMAARFFNNLGLQILITTVQPENVLSVFPDAKMFHVEHV